MKGMNVRRWLRPLGVIVLVGLCGCSRHPN
jgi:hypothetical protein